MLLIWIAPWVDKYTKHSLRSILRHACVCANSVMCGCCIECHHIKLFYRIVPNNAINVNTLHVVCATLVCIFNATLISFTHTHKRTNTHHIHAHTHTPPPPLHTHTFTHTQTHSLTHSHVWTGSSASSARPLKKYYRESEEGKGLHQFRRTRRAVRKSASKFIRQS